MPVLVAKQIVKAIDRPKRERTIGALNKVIKRVAGLRGARGDVAKLVVADRRPHVVITGAADGIGYQLAHRYAAGGYRVTGIDNNVKHAAKLQEELTVAGTENTMIVADLMQEWAWIDRVIAADVVIHNAGISAAGRFEQSDIGHQAAVIQLNLLAPLQLTARLLANDAIASGGSLVFVSSLSNYMSYPGASVYAGTKDGLAHYAHSLRLGLHPHQHVLTVFPGPIRTEHARRYSPDNSREDNRMSPGTLADLIFNAQQLHKPILLPGGGAKAAAQLGKRAPRLSEYAMRRTILDKFDDD